MIVISHMECRHCGAGQMVTDDQPTPFCCNTGMDIMTTESWDEQDFEYRPQVDQPAAQYTNFVDLLPRRDS